MIAEEACEVGQAAGKCIRFTPHHTYASYHESNLDRLKEELIDLIAVYYLAMAEIGEQPTIDDEEVLSRARRKSETLHISRTLGVID
jgi:NTP pyrophosphatase (non-canonical NTP hydrolase)